jgi:hypothetical protein
MASRNFPQQLKRFEIEAYKKPEDLKALRKSHIPFSGAPHKHPYDPKKIILVPDPYSSIPFYYEFRRNDVSFAEEMPSIVNLEGETVKMARVWIKKESVGLLCSPFLVEDTSTRLKAGASSPEQ